MFLPAVQAILTLKIIFGLITCGTCDCWSERTQYLYCISLCCCKPPADHVLLFDRRSYGSESVVHGCFSILACVFKFSLHLTKWIFFCLLLQLLLVSQLLLSVLFVDQVLTYLVLENERGAEHVLLIELLFLCLLQ